MHHPIGKAATILKSVPISMRTALLIAAWLSGYAAVAGTLEQGWQNPPNEARLRAYWWWLNGNVTKGSITRDLEEMKAKGFGGAVIVDADGSSQDGNDEVPHGPTFFTPEWRDLYKHTLSEANRLGLEMSLNIQSGWNLGGPVVSKDDAAKKYVWSETAVTGGTNLTISLPTPRYREDYYRDFAVVAFPVKNNTPNASLRNFRQKALQQSLQPFSTPDSSPLFAESAATDHDADFSRAEVIDLTTNLDATGTLNWDAPTGQWCVIRFGYTIGDNAYVSTSSEGWDGFALDVYNAQAFQTYWNRIVEPLIQDAGPLAGHTLKYVHTDSWEIELANWTPNLRAEFQQRRGYDLLSWLPVFTGRIENSRDQSDRFLFDYRKTLGDLTIDDHYRLFRDNAHKHGIDIHPESGGPHAVPIDAQRDLGWDDVPMSEFWAWSWTHRIGDQNRFFVKQPASAAHTYGHRITQDEGFTTIGPNWQEHIWDNLKPSFDKALCEGMNRLVWHAFVCSPDATGIPGQQYFAGTHLNPKVTWWDKSAPFFSYINRCQYLLQQGLFVADVCYYYGDHVPDFSQLKSSDPAHILPGYDYDVISEEALLTRASVSDGRIVLPDGMSYRVLVLPPRDAISLPVLQKINALVTAGATVIGPQPKHDETLQNYPDDDATTTILGDQLWNHHTGPGRVICNQSARDVLQADGIAPDCDIQSASSASDAHNFDYIHRHLDDTEIYFIANRNNAPASATVTFRVSGKAPEIWDPVSGEHHFATAYREANGRTTLPLDFAPCGSCFVIFRESAASHSAIAQSNGQALSPLTQISGPWTVHFDPKWGGPASVQFDSLVSWPTRSEPGIKYYSGIATYEKTFVIPDHQLSTINHQLFLDLGDVRELASVKVNGKPCGITWCPPWRVDITDAVTPGENKLEIDVVNFWPNRIIGDAVLPPNERYTRTNIRKLTADTPLEPAGLFGPVQLLTTPNP